MSVITFHTTIAYRHDLSFKVVVEGTREMGVTDVFAAEEDGRDIFEFISDRALQQLEEELIQEIADAEGVEVDRVYDQIRDERFTRSFEI